MTKTKVRQKKKKLCGILIRLRVSRVFLILFTEHGLANQIRGPRDRCNTLLRCLGLLKKEELKKYKIYRNCHENVIAIK